MRRECLASEDQVAELSKTLQGREHMARAEQSRAEQSNRRPSTICLGVLHVCMHTFCATPSIDLCWRQMPKNEEVDEEEEEEQVLSDEFRWMRLMSSKG